MQKFKITIMAFAAATATVASAQTPGPQRLAPVEAPLGKTTATVDLGKEFPQLSGYVFTQGINTIAPGTGRALHSHVGSPEIVRILSGTLTVSVNGGPPVAYGPGSTLINAGGISHTWANLGTTPVVFVNTVVKKAPEPGK